MCTAHEPSAMSKFKIWMWVKSCSLLSLQTASFAKRLLVCMRLATSAHRRSKEVLASGHILCDRMLKAQPLHPNDFNVGTPSLAKDLPEKTKTTKSIKKRSPNHSRSFCTSLLLGRRRALFLSRSIASPHPASASPCAPLVPGLPWAASSGPCQHCQLCDASAPLPQEERLALAPVGPLVARWIDGLDQNVWHRAVHWTSFWATRPVAGSSALPNKWRPRNGWVQFGHYLSGLQKPRRIPHPPAAHFHSSQQKRNRQCSSPESSLYLHGSMHMTHSGGMKPQTDCKISSLGQECLRDLAAKTVAYHCWAPACHLVSPKRTLVSTALGRPCPTVQLKAADGHVDWRPFDIRRAGTGCRANRVLGSRLGKNLLQSCAAPGSWATSQRDESHLAWTLTSSPGENLAPQGKRCCGQPHELCLLERPEYESNLGSVLWWRNLLHVWFPDHCRKTAGASTHSQLFPCSCGHAYQAVQLQWPEGWSSTTHPTLWTFQPGCHSPSRRISSGWLCLCCATPSPDCPQLRWNVSRFPASCGASCMHRKAMLGFCSLQMLLQWYFWFDSSRSPPSLSRNQLHLQKREFRRSISIQQKWAQFGSLQALHLLACRFATVSQLHKGNATPWW